MIINIRVDHGGTRVIKMENIYNDLKDIFINFKNKFNVNEYVEISTCNRHEFYIHSDAFGTEDELDSIDFNNIIVEFNKLRLWDLWLIKFFDIFIKLP